MGSSSSSREKTHRISSHHITSHHINILARKQHKQYRTSKHTNERTRSGSDVRGLGGSTEEANRNVMRVARVRAGSINASREQVYLPQAASPDRAAPRRGHSTVLIARRESASARSSFVNGGGSGGGGEQIAREALEMRDRAQTGINCWERKMRTSRFSRQIRQSHGVDLGFGWPDGANGSSFPQRSHTFWKQNL